MKNEQNQEFKSTSVLLLIGLLALTLVIIAIPWNQQIRDNGVQAALHKAEVVGYQVVQIYREALVSNSTDEASTRLPASVESARLSDSIRTTGTMGLDPWGSAYHYRILSADPTGNVRILVWSSGPNKKVETKYLTDEESLLETQPVYDGDDLGVLLSMTHR